MIVGVVGGSVCIALLLYRTCSRLVVDHGGRGSLGVRVRIVGRGRMRDPLCRLRRGIGQVNLLSLWKSQNCSSSVLWVSRR